MRAHAHARTYTHIQRHTQRHTHRNTETHSHSSLHQSTHAPGWLIYSFAQEAADTAAGRVQALELELAEE